MNVKLIKISKERGGKTMPKTEYVEKTIYNIEGVNVDFIKMVRMSGTKLSYQATIRQVKQLKMLIVYHSLKIN